jgi:predicted DNA-binding helix-hairpin-helix protein
MPAGQTTQFVVGASEESDREILECMENLYTSFSLRRCYFSAYIPILKSPQSHRSPPLTREHHLYQTDFLLRQYGFQLKDISFNDKDNLPLRYDPKFICALRRKDLFPMDVNEAPVCDLVKVPGIGPTSAQRIAAARKSGFRFSKMAELKNVGVMTRKACGFIDIGKKIQTRLCYDV